MTTAPRCPECGRRGWHKMSCDTGTRLRTGGGVNLDEFTSAFDTASLLTMPSTDSGTANPAPCPPPDTPYPCGGGSE